MKNSNYKQTEIGEIPENWDLASLEQFVVINPLRSLKKGVTAKYVPMANLQPFDKKILGYELKPYNGGMKFVNTDTLVARITPCLENGKTAFVDLLKEDEVGFGSTEYIVLNKIESVTNSQFIYYLSLSPRFRDIAIRSMVGSSGRQRVHTDKLATSKFAFPKLAEQRQIASILASLDDKIELNRKMNKTLEDMGKTLFKRWFVNFEFPNENGKPYKSNGGEMVNSELGEIPQGWTIKDLGEIFEINTKSVNPSKFPDKVFWHFSIPSYDQYGSPTLEAGITIKSNKTQIQDRSILVSKLNPKQEVRIWSVYSDSWGGNAISSTEFINFVPDGKDWAFANFLFRNDDFYNRFADMSTGSTGSRQRVRPTEAKNLNFVYPGEHVRLLFNSVIEPVLVEIDKNVRETMKLIELRDSLLPRLMSGKLRI